MQYRWEPLSYLLLTGINDLGARSWEENGYDKDILTYNPDWERYKRLEAENILRFMAIRDEEALVGYASVIITNSFHDKDICCAIVQDFYVVPEKRGFAGLKLFSFLEEQLETLGVNHMAAAERLKNNNRTGRLFEHLGFHSDERIWTKSIGGHA